MKICHLIYDDIANPWLAGGGAVRAREIYRRLAERHQVTLITGLYPGAQREEEIDGIRFVRVGSDRSYARSRLAYCHASVEQLEQMSWDVWVNEFSAFAPLRVPADTRRRGVLFFQHFMGRHALAKRPLVGLPAWLAERRVLSAYPRILTVSPSVQQGVEDRVKGRNIPVDCVFNGVDRRYFNLSSKSGDYVLFLGRADVHMKGLDLLVAAFAQISESYPNLRLKIAGRAEETQTALLHKLVSASGVEGCIDVLGAVSEEQKDALLANARFACMPSRYEGWGIAAVEAQAAGKAVLATQISGLQDAVRHGETGHLVAPDNVSALADGMRYLLDNEPVRSQMEGRAQAWARRFDWDQLALDQEGVYLRAIDANSD